VYGNSNTLASNLNSRVIQMVIAKNLTLAQAWGILDLARTNTTNAVTSFPFFATSEFYTLGFAREVSKLAAKTSVANGGNFTVLAPSPNFWRPYWNMIAGWAERGTQIAKSPPRLEGRTMPYAAAGISGREGPGVSGMNGMKSYVPSEFSSIDWREHSWTLP